MAIAPPSLVWLGANSCFFFGWLNWFLPQVTEKHVEHQWEAVPFLIGFSIVNDPFWGTLISGNTHVCQCQEGSTFCCSYVLPKAWRNTKIHVWWNSFEYKYTRFCCSRGWSYPIARNGYGHSFNKYGANIQNSQSTWVKFICLET